MRSCPECGMAAGLCICDDVDEFNIEDTGDFDADELGIDPEEEDE